MKATMMKIIYLGILLIVTSLSSMVQATSFMDNGLPDGKDLSLSEISDTEIIVNGWSGTKNTVKIPGGLERTNVLITLL